MTESEKEAIKSEYRKSIKDLAKLYRDNDTRQRGRAFLLGCMESLQPYPVALGLLLSIFPSDHVDGLSVVPSFLDVKKPDARMSDPESVEAEKPGQKNQGRNLKPGTDDSIVLHADPVPVASSENVEPVTTSDVIQPLKPSDAVLDAFDGDMDDLPIDDETRLKLTNYAEQIEDITRTYIETVRNGDTKRPEKWVPDLMYYIHARIEKPDRRNLSLLNGLWSIHKYICRRCQTIPTLEKFGDMVGISPAVFSKIQGNNQGKYQNLSPAWVQTIQKWKREAGAALSDDVTSSDGTSVNKIFILKSCYGYTESAPVQRVEVAAAAPSAYPVLGLAEKPENITSQS